MSPLLPVPFFFPLRGIFLRGRFPLIQQHFSRPQVLDVTPTQDAPCLPGTGSDDDGHPDGAPSSLPRHPTGECPPSTHGPLVTPNSCINYYAFQNNDPKFHPKMFISETGKNETPWTQSPGLKGFGSNYLGFFPKPWVYFGVAGSLGKPTRPCVCSRQVNKLERRNVWLNRDRLSRRNGLLIYFYGVFWQPVVGEKKTSATLLL